MSELLYKFPYTSFDDLLLLQDLLPFFEGYDKKPIQLTIEHTLVNAYWMSEFCRLSYITSEGKIQEECDKIKMTSKCFWVDDTEFLVAHDAEKIVIVARGTESSKIGDLLTDLKFSRVIERCAGRVHSGFKDALDCAWGELCDYISVNSVGKFVFYTGHSLGAALVTIAASRTDCSALYTFGSPRVGNGKFSLYVDIRFPHYRYINAGDPFSSLPPPILGWKHSGKKYVISSDIFYREDIPVSGWGKFLSKTLVLKFLMIFSLGKWVMLDLVSEHSILSFNNYLRWQVNLPPHAVPKEYLERLNK